MDTSQDSGPDTAPAVARFTTPLPPRDLVPTVRVPADAPDAALQIARGLGAGPFSLVTLFISPQADSQSLKRQLRDAFPVTRIMGCTTAGEISDLGYDEGSIVAVAFPVEHFGVETILIPDLNTCTSRDLVSNLIRTRQTLARRYPRWGQEFAFLLVDGLSVKEDELTAALASGIGPVPLFGGSAGDGVRFRETFVLTGDQRLQNAAVLAFVRTDCRVKVFNFDHLIPTDQRMVVTAADPQNRIVREINAEPAAREYARLLGKDPEQLSRFTFAAHPVVVRMGGRHHVRAIQKVAENGDLVFFSAIDEGLVLTLAQPSDMVAHLEGAFAGLSRDFGPPARILACDCILRRLEAEEKQASGALSDILKRYNARGFSTYGEQLGSMHVNQTMTGVAIYPPSDT
ncbi:FIST N domain protein [Aquimixticola soesokkakensis]|uniref:FIST N domain protein n=1 Tax=Aquimixticola soesokkakensis TaxID=1519096 RepID=A0A1Y5RTZ2_9RHOB|nr:FIST N-terminal domain-containing protein [Aquimixticola soesokkakensis]SLN25415.1 FIST N domain protein [Aquimixticola soesokkakensis]